LKTAAFLLGFATAVAATAPPASTQAATSAPSKRLGFLIFLLLLRV
jgi:hypothetical protein